MTQYGVESHQKKLEYDLVIRGERITGLTGDELRELTKNILFSLAWQDGTVVSGPTGVEFQFEGAPVGIHLCYSDEAEEFAKAVVAASGLDEVAA